MRATPNGRAHQLYASARIRSSATPSQQGVIASARLATRVAPSLRLDLTPVDLAHRDASPVRQSPTVGDEVRRALPVRPPPPHGGRARAARDVVAVARISCSRSTRSRSSRSAATTRSASSPRRLGRRPLAADLAQRLVAHRRRARSIDEPDYRVASLRSTAVLRWELRPGSILYVVWQQARGGIPQLPSADAARDRARGLHAAGDPHARGEAELLVRLGLRGRVTSRCACLFMST